MLSLERWFINSMSLVFGIIGLIIFILFLMACFITSSEITREEEEMKRIRVRAENHNKDINKK